MDEDSKELVKLAAEGGVEGFLRTAAAPLVEIGGWGADLIRRYRVKSAIKTMALADRWLAEAGLSAHEIPLNILVPLLEYSSLADDPDEAADREEATAMHERWAALLANAAAGDEGATVLPAFPRILSELAPPEARLLELIARDEYASPPVWAFMEALGFDADDEEQAQAYAVHVDNLERLNLCTISRPSGDVRRLAEELERQRRSQETFPPVGRRIRPPSTTPTVRVSALGKAFIAACTRP